MSHKTPFRFRRAHAATLAGVLIAAFMAAGRANAQSDCADLAGRASVNTMITATTVVSGKGASPDYCRVLGEVRPVPASRIGFELWLPEAGWNGKFEMVGNGGYSSMLDTRAMARLLAAGYAVAATDTGHQGDDPDFAVGRPAAIVDWAYRAVHLTAVEAKALTRRRYGRAPAHAYFAGCSTGGQQAMSEAQRFPEDFDGIIAGASGGDRTHLNAGFLWQFRVNHRPGDAAPILPASKLAMVTQAVVRACQSDNGARGGGLATDDWLDDPAACRFTPDALLCADDHDRPDCLTGAQVAALKAMYAGARNPRTGQVVAAGYPFGSESVGGPPSLPGWSLYWSDPAHSSAPARSNFWRVWAGFGPAWDPWRFDFDADMAKTDARLAAIVNATNPNLDKFAARGGKLIVYHGTADPVVPFSDSVRYHEAVEARVARRDGVALAKSRIDRFYRLFLAPGMGHCGGGPGLTSVETQSALENWVERGLGPDRLLAVRREAASPASGLTRPLCPYPGKAQYDGKGDPRDAGAFQCRISAAFAAPT